MSLFTGPAHVIADIKKDTAEIVKTLKQRRDDFEKVYRMIYYMEKNYWGHKDMKVAPTIGSYIRSHIRGVHPNAYRRYAKGAEMLGATASLTMTVYGTMYVAYLVEGRKTAINDAQAIAKGAGPAITAYRAANQGFISEHKIRSICRPEAATVGITVAASGTSTPLTFKHIARLKAVILGAHGQLKNIPAAKSTRDYLKKQGLDYIKHHGL